MALLNLVKMTTATVGTGTITLGSAVSGFLTMAQAGAVNGTTYSYGISDGTNSEVGTGVYTAAGTTLTRTVIKSTNANALITLSGTAKVYITPLAEDFAALATLASPALTGVPLAPTATPDVNTTQIATTQYVHASEEAVVVAVTGGAVTLSAAQCAVAAIILTGTLVSNLTVSFGSGSACFFNRTYTVYNLTSGAFTVTLQACVTSPATTMTCAPASTVGLVTYTNIINHLSDSTNADLFTSTVRGVVPASGGGTTNFLRADGTWTAAGGASDPLLLATENSGVPSTPATGVTLYAAKRANRRMLEWETPTGRTERVGPWLGDNNTILVQATWNATTLTSLGLNFSATVGTTSAATYATTNFITMQRRTQSTIATAAGMVAWEAATPICSRAPGNGGGGFHASWRFYIIAMNTDAKFFCGLGGTAAFTNVNPSTLTNIIGFGKISTDTTVLKLFANGSSGTAQGIALPNTGSMTGIANTAWQVEIFCKTGDTQFGYRVTRTGQSGGESVDEGVTTGTQGGAGGIPADATAFAPHLWGGNTSAVALTLQFGQFFLDSD